MSLPKWINHSVDAFIEMLAVVDHYVFGHDYDLPVTDAGAERLTELEQEREAWEANELFDQMASGIRTACGPYVRLPEWFGGPYPVSSVLMPDGSLSTERYKSSPLAGVQRAASPEGVSDETPDTPPPSGRTEADDQAAPEELTPTSALLYAAMNFLTWGMEFDAGHPFITELKDRAARFALLESGPISVDLDDLDAHITAIRTTWLNCHHLGLPTPTLSHEIAADLLANYYITRK